jgi:hypothetical protein
VLSEIYPNITFEKSWYNSFKLQFQQIKSKTDLPNNNFNVFNRDGGFMDYITRLVNTEFDIVKKDSWNPADIWLIKSSKLKNYKSKLDEAVNVEACNTILKEAFAKKEIVGISLKKNNGRQLNYEIVNLKSSDKDQEVEMDKFELNIPYDSRKKKFTSSTSSLIIEYQNKKFSMGVKSNQEKIGNITYEFSGKGAAAFLGKVPKNMLQIELKKDNAKMPEHTDFMEFDRKDFEKKIKEIKANQSIFQIKGDLDSFVDNLEQSWSKGRQKDNVIISQIVTFAYIIAKMTIPRRKEFVRDLFFLAQKKGFNFGPFGKLY